MRSRTTLPVLLVAAALLAAGCDLVKEKPAPTPAVAASNCLPTYEIIGATGAWRIAGYSQAALNAPIADDLRPYDDGIVSGSGALRAFHAARVLELGEPFLNDAGFGQTPAAADGTPLPIRSLDLAELDAVALDLYLGRNTLVVPDPSAPSPTPSPAPSGKPGAKPSPSAAPSEEPSKEEEVEIGPRFDALLAVPTISIEARIGSCREDEGGEFLAYETTEVLAFDGRVDEVVVYGVSCDEPLVPSAPAAGDPYQALDPLDLERIHASACATLSA